MSSTFTDNLNANGKYRPSSDNDGYDDETDDSPAKPAIWLDADDWNEADIPKRPWIAPGYALRGAVTLIAGPPSAMKSSVTLSWAVSLALGLEFGRFKPITAGRALVYNVEDDQNEQRRRLSATLRNFGAKPSEIRNRVYRVGPSQIGTLLERGEDGQIQRTRAMKRLRQVITEIRPDIFVVDPLAELHNVEENDNNALRTIIAHFRQMAIEFQMAVIILHHTRKGAGNAAGDPDAARGASAIIGAVRVAVTLTTMSEDDAKNFGLPTSLESRSNYIRMDDAKSNYAPLKGAQWFEKLAYELDNGESVPAAAPWLPPSAKTASLNDFLALIESIQHGSPIGEPWSAKLSGDARSVRKLLVEHGFHGDAQHQVLTDLQANHGLTIEKYKRPGNRSVVGGLRIADKPHADWVEEDK